MNSPTDERKWPEVQFLLGICACLCKLSLVYYACLISFISFISLKMEISVGLAIHLFIHVSKRLLQ